MVAHICRKGSLLKIICVTFLIFFVTTICWVTTINFSRPGQIFCSYINAPSLPDILDDNPPLGKSIFFHETSCKSYSKGRIYVERRQACAVESAALLHPNRTVYLIFTSPGIIGANGTEESDRFVNALLSYNNVRIRHVNLNKYTEGTLVEGLYKSNKIKNSIYAQSHTSDLLRYVTLWRYGGIYLDLDVVVIKSFDTLEKNFAGAESTLNVAAGVMGFDNRDIGHEYATSCLEDLANNYKEDDWGNNGPGVITRLSRKLCGEQKAENMIKKPCRGFKVYGPSYFYPVRWQDWRKYFGNETINLKQSYAIHVWNMHSVKWRISLKSNSTYIKYARMFCPKILKECDNYF